MIKRSIPTLLYTLLALGIMFPLFSHGYVFLIDMVWGPTINLTLFNSGGTISPGTPLVAIFWLLSFIIPTFLIQKLLLLGILAGIGVSANRLASRFLPFGWALVSGVLYIFNPYVYERFLAGHWMVLIGYALFPLVIYLTLDLLEKFTLKRFVVFTLAVSLYPLFSLHWAYISSFFLIILACVYGIKQNKIARIKVKHNEAKSDIKHGENFFCSLFTRKTALFCIIFAVVYFSINLFWLVGITQESSTLTQITLNDFVAFQTTPDETFGVVPNMLSLYGFWQANYFLPKDTFPMGWIGSAIIFFLAVIGGWRAIKKKNVLGMTFAVVFVPVVVVAVGYGSEITRPIIDVLYNWIPAFCGLRETGKVIGILALSYAILAPFGLKYLIDRVIPNARASSSVRALPQLALAFVGISTTFLFFWGAGGQIKPHDYPRSWYEAKEYLQADASMDRVLFLPWHGYPILDFAGNERIGNPAPVFFGKSIVSGKNLDSVFLQETSLPEWDRRLTLMIHGGQTLDDNAMFLKERNITHVMLARIHDHGQYTFLDESDNIKKIFERDDLVVYEVVFVD